jgi:hypothetical protein
MNLDGVCVGEDGLDVNSQNQISNFPYGMIFVTQEQPKNTTPSLYKSIQKEREERRRKKKRIVWQNRESGFCSKTS